MPLKCYVPKGADVANWDRKIRTFLTPCARSAELVEQYRNVKSQGSYRRDEVEPNFLRMKEKRLELSHWKVGGGTVRGSHFPLCVFTNNVGRRSPNATAERNQKALARQNARRSGGAGEPWQERSYRAGGHGWSTSSSGGAEEPWPERYDPAGGQVWSTSSWVSNDGSVAHVWYSWWSRADEHRSGGASSYSSGSQ